MSNLLRYRIDVREEDNQESTEGFPKQGEGTESDSEKAFDDVIAQHARGEYGTTYLIHLYWLGSGGQEVPQRTVRVTALDPESACEMAEEHRFQGEGSVHPVAGVPPSQR